MSDKTNWVGIAYTCESKVDPDPETSPQLEHAFAWARLAISIHESLATGFSPEGSEGALTGAMWVRAKLIVRCGNHLGDSICDCNKLVEWCIGLPSVRQTLQMEKVPPVDYVDPEARSVAQILEYLVVEGPLKREGDVARLLDLIALAKQISRGGGVEDLKLRTATGEF